MKPITHIIERQVLDLTLDTDDEAQARQKAARRVVLDRVQPVLDEVFTRLTGPDRVLRLDQLDLDLGVLPVDDWGERLVERLREQVEQELRRHVHESLYGEAAASKRVAQSQLEAFMVFLDSGSLPWWMPDAASFDPGAVLLDLITSRPEALRAALQSGYRPGRAHRLVAQVMPEVIEQLHTLMAPAAATLIKQVERAWQRLGEANLSSTGWQPPSKAQVETAVLDLILAINAPATITEKKLHEAIGRQGAKHGDAVDRLVQALALLSETEVAALYASEAGSLVAWLYDSMVTSSAQPAVDDSGLAENKRRTDHRAREGGIAPSVAEMPEDPQKAEQDDTTLLQETDASAAVHEATETRHPSPASEAEAETMKQDGAEASSVQQEAQAEDIERAPDQEPFETVTASHLEGSFYVTNAGLVLLWPFLGRFFKKMKLVEDNTFRSPTLQQRAVLLTHYLVTGETEAPEQVLLLNKILCGWPLKATVPRAIDLTLEERDESQVLLEAAVTQWSALRNTSVAGLQQAFLQREGRLLKQPQAWTLKVDRTGYDVLLERLPWSISIVKQTWMPQPLFVEW